MFSLGFALLMPTLLHYFFVCLTTQPRKISGLPPSQHLPGGGWVGVHSFFPRLILQFPMDDPHFVQHLHFMVCIHHGK